MVAADGSPRRLGPACFDCDPETGQAVLTNAADDHATLVASVAAQLKFPLTPQHPHFHGRRGNSWLHVTYRPLTQDIIHDIVAHLPEGHTVTIASTTVLDGAAQAIRTAARGSRVVHIPGDLFPTVEGGQR